MAKNPFADVDFDALTPELSRLEEIGHRVRVAGFGLAAPLVNARTGQLLREARRAERRFGKDHPETRARTAAAERATRRFQLFREERDRARVSPPPAPEKDRAAIWGRVTDARSPSPSY